MLKMQLLGHSSIKDDLKRYLRARGVVEITTTEAGSATDPAAVTAAAGSTRELESGLENAENALEYLTPHETRKSFFQKVSEGPLETSDEISADLAEKLPVTRIANRCTRLHGALRASRDGLARSRELVSSLEPWRGLDVPMEALGAGEYTVQFWSFPEKTASGTIAGAEDAFPLTVFETAAEVAGRRYVAVIVSAGESDSLGERLKEGGGSRYTFEGLEGPPSSIIERERASWPGFERSAEEAEKEARELAGSNDEIRILSDYYREAIGIEEVEGRLSSTDSTFLMEGWVRALDRPSLKDGIDRRFAEVEISFRDPLEDEEPPVHLDNRGVTRPYEFVTTLYGRPVYREDDPTPMLAPFFVLFFAMCLTDAGYGLTLAALASFVLLRFKPKGGARNLFNLLFAGGLVTAAVGIIAGGIFGLGIDSFPAWLRPFVLINPLEEPMKMLNISFLMGIVHILFGIGVRMRANFRARLIADALFDDLAWMIFIAALAPLGFAGILGGEVPPAVISGATRVSLGIAAVIFITGGRKQRSYVMKILGGLVKFYDIVGYFGDVLSYARLLALGLATSAIALAVNDIASMVRGMPYYIGYIVMVLILIGGHLFNLAVNTLGSFVHSARLQYLEFFGKFFQGGGAEFKPFKSERKYSVLKDSD
jgi:V/A-type H+-transporting ATPase subunit I